MIELDDKSYIVGLWFSECPQTGNNVLSCLIGDPDKPNFFKGWTRTRYKRDEKIFDSDDKKNWIGFSSREGQTEDFMIATMDELQEMGKIIYPLTDKIIVKGDLKKLMEMSITKPWMNMKCEPIPDVKQ